jgi:predicted DNA-binding protein
MYGGMYVHANPTRAGTTKASFEARRIMARKKISTTIYITPEQNERLKLLHDRTKVPIAVYIREGIDLVLERHVGELPGQLLLAAANDKK